jgi:ribosomal protein L35AE/L33A
VISKKESNGIRYYTKGIILGYRRNLRSQNVSQVRIKIPNIKTHKDLSFFLGKRLLYIQENFSEKKKKLISGKISSFHGRSGVFIARFKKKIPPSSMNSIVYVTLLPFTKTLEQKK